MDWQSQLVSNKDKQAQINYFFQKVTFTIDVMIHLKYWNRSRRDNGEVEMNEIQATTMSGFIELLLFWERELEELDKIPLNFCSVKCVFLHPAFSGD